MKKILHILVLILISVSINFTSIEAKVLPQNELPLSNDSITGVLDVIYGDDLDSQANKFVGSGKVEYYVTNKNNGEVYNLNLEKLNRNTNLKALAGKQVLITGEIKNNSQNAKINKSALKNSNDLVFKVSKIQAVSQTKNSSADSQIQPMLNDNDAKKPWFNILCKFADINDEPIDVTTVQNTFSNSFPFLGDYWDKTTFGRIDISGTQTKTEWHTLPHERSYYIDDFDGDGNLEAHLSQLASDCRSVVGFSDDGTYFGTNLYFNAALDGPAWGGTSNGLHTTWLPTWAHHKISVLAHEMGHAYGLPHSSGRYGYDYDSPWDVMSDAYYNNYSAPSPYQYIPQHTIAFHKYNLGALAESYVHTINPVNKTTDETFHITRLEEQPSAGTGDYSLVNLYTRNGKHYTLEARDTASGLDGYDENLPAKAVIIHEIEPGGFGDGRAYVLDLDNNEDPGDESAQWITGETFLDSDSGLKVEIVSETATGFNVKVSKIDIIAPTITLNGPEITIIAKGLTFIDYGAVCTDDDDETCNVVVNGDLIDTNSIGIHTITYNATDTAGNQATEVTRTVVVTDTSLSKNDIDENSPIGSKIGSLSTIGNVPPYTYRLVPGIGGEDNDKFLIENSELKLNFVPDFETPEDIGNNAGNNTYSIKIETQDNSAKSDGVDYSSAYNDYGGFNNAPNYANFSAFAALKSDGSISSWGNSSYGGSNAPTDSGYKKIYSTRYAFAALKEDGSISVWGDSDYGGAGAPTDAGYKKIYSTYGAFAALKEDGSISVWGDSRYGGSSAPTDKGYTKIYSTIRAFAALKEDGSISVWGDSDYGGTGAPTNKGYTKIYSTNYAFAAMKSDGSITSWGSSYSGGSGAPTDNGYIRVYSTRSAFAAMKSDGSITSWGSSYSGGTGAPTDNGYIRVYSTGSAFAALKEDGSISVWGDSDWGGSGASIYPGYTKIYSTNYAFAAMKSDGSISTWGSSYSGGSGAPSGFGYRIPYGGNNVKNTIKKQFIITVNNIDEDKIAPIITLNGASTINLTVGDTYTEQGATCADDTDAICNVVIGGDLVDTNTTGTYTVTYNAIDNAGNYATEIKRIIVVTYKPVPIFRLYNRRTGAQLYARGEADKNKILAKFRDFEFTDGAPAFWADLSTQAGLTPIYRLYNRRTGAQLYTRGDADKNKILAKFHDFEFTDGEPAFWASLTDNGTTPIFRLYNRRTGMQLYTRGEADKNKILAKFHDFEFTDDGPAFYASLTN